MKVTVQDSSLATDVPNDVYYLTCVSYELNQGQYGPYLRWYFEIVSEGEHAGKKVSGITPASLTPGSKLDVWLQGFGFPPATPGETVDLDSCIGVKVKGIIENTSVARRDDPTKTIELPNVTKLIKKSPTTKPQPVNQPVQVQPQPQIQPQQQQQQQQSSTPPATGNTQVNVSGQTTTTRQPSTPPPSAPPVVPDDSDEWPEDFS